MPANQTMHPSIHIILCFCFSPSDLSQHTHSYQQGEWACTSTPTSQQILLCSLVSQEDRSCFPAPTTLCFTRSPPSWPATEMWLNMRVNSRLLFYSYVCSALEIAKVETSIARAAKTLLPNDFVSSYHLYYLLNSRNTGMFCTLL